MRYQHSHTPKWIINWVAEVEPSKFIKHPTLQSLVVVHMFKCRILERTILSLVFPQLSSKLTWFSISYQWLY